MESIGSDAGWAGRVSVIVPCYNAAPFLRDTIEAVLAQRYPDVELIVVDDGSTDGSWDVIRSYGERIRALRLDRNRGGCFARNRGAELATGAFLMFMDADDLLTPDTLHALVTALADRPCALAACRWRRLEQVRGRWVPSANVPQFPPPYPDPLQGWLRGHFFPPCALLWPRAVYESSGGWDEALRANQDGELVMRILVSGTELVFADAGQAYYRAHRKRRSVGNDYTSERSYRSRMRVLDTLVAELEQRGRLADYAVPLGHAYHRLAQVGFMAHPALARTCLERGRVLAGQQLVARTLPGRILSRLLGMETKERIAVFLARWGIASRSRLRIMRP